MLLDVPASFWVENVVVYLRSQICRKELGRYRLKKTWSNVERNPVYLNCT